ncbi:MAG: hypothetical protein JRK53_04195 [Deltaproteobacteria bacterium]|nr:hypothetical protein [Deltaproteobacteria bacterium]MBW1816966.1 hypothetical protein [Deltaproteobacteria bacterium]
MLAGQGFAEVYNLKGGIKAWNGHTAVGPREMGMWHLPADASIVDMLALAYAMEAGLGELYRQIGADLHDEPAVALIDRLAKMEEGHKRKVFNLYRKLDPEAADLEDADEPGGIVEGGFTTKMFLQENRAVMETVEGILTVAMMLEVQAMDLYMRYAQRATVREGRHVLHDLAEEEKSHLKDLGKLMDGIA